MKRISMNYDVTDGVSVADGEALVPAVIDDVEFAQFVAGQRSDVSPGTRKKIRAALRSSDARVTLFLAAYAQRSMSRLARLMRALDSVDHEVMQEWRLRTMDTGELLTLYSELSTDRSRSVKELLDISGGKPTGRQDPLSFLEDDEDDSGRGSVLSKRSKEKVVAFYDRVVVKKSRELDK